MVTAVLLALLGIASLPLGWRAIARIAPHLGPTSAVHALRAYSIKVTVLAELLLITISVAAHAAWHIPLALLGLHTLVLSLLFLAPLYMLAYEPKPHYTKETSTNIFGFSLLAAMLSYANFAFSFAREGLSSNYVSTNNPFYFKAAAIALLTLFLCQGLNLLLARVNHHGNVFTQHLLDNKDLLYAFGGSLVALSILIYIPALSHLLKLASLGFSDWIWALVAASIYLGVRLLQRHTRKHSRTEIIRLHHQAARKHL